MKYLLFTVLVAASASLALAGSEKVSYDRDVKPLLSDTCFRCHGPDIANNKPSRDPLRLDILEAATADRNGTVPIVPGNSEASEIIARIFSDDKDELMPPPDSHLVLTDTQKETLRRWVDEGAVYEKHWSFVPPEKVAPPVVSHKDWPKTPIDYFVLARLEAQGLNPSPSVSRELLIRRATLALTGLQPTPDEVDAFLDDIVPDAYDRLLDRLLASPRYGEHMAIGWLEAARFADTDGYQNDGKRTLWPWRDWVIKALNENLPYDQFSIKQLAGDMLPDATDQDILASAFNRNHRINNEGGALPEEFIVEYAIDRVETTSTIWLGLTAGCARCHDHKYDQFTQKEFYQLYSYFNSIPEKGNDAGAKAAPNIRARSPFAKDDGTESKLVAKREELELARTNSGARQVAWEREMATSYHPKKDTWSIPATLQVKPSPDGSNFTGYGDGSYVYSGSDKEKIRYSFKVAADAAIKTLGALRIEALPLPEGYGDDKLAHTPTGNFFLTDVRLRIKKKGGGTSRPIKWARVEASYSQDGHPVTNIIDGKKKTGWGVGGHPAGGVQVILVPEKPLGLTEGDQLHIDLHHDGDPKGHSIGRVRLGIAGDTTDGIPGIGAPAIDPSIFTALNTPASERDGKQQNKLTALFRSQDPELLRLAAEEFVIRRKWEKMTVSVLVMDEKEKPTPTYLLQRGAYDQPDKSEVLKRALPASIVSPTTSQPADRLALARWLVSRDNPLAARVFVNLVWQQHFGVGLVKTAEDFGAQGERPSHPDLLDWLAVEFIESGWDMKHLHKLVLTSATWRQDSAAPAEAFAARPENRLIDRGPRFRLSGYSIRDAALAASGLLVERLGGSPVKPYQPAGLWESMAGSAGTRYTPSGGDGLYRRSLYTYWKRAVNPPRQIIFDSATREMCSVTLKRTNTPLQALVLMNDVTFVEAARGLAARMIKEGGATDEDRLRYGYRLATGTVPTAKDLTAARAAYTDFLASYRGDQVAAEELLSIGDSPLEPVLDDHADYAAYTAAAHLFLNLDRAITLE